MVGKTRHNIFWDSTERAQAVYTPPQDVVHLSELSSERLPALTQFHTQFDHTQFHEHAFGVVSFMKPTWCNHCQSILIGVSNQGQQCSDPQCLLTLCHSCAGSNASTYAGSSGHERRYTASSASSVGGKS